MNLILAIYKQEKAIKMPWSLNQAPIKAMEFFFAFFNKKRSTTDNHTIYIYVFMCRRIFWNNGIFKFYVLYGFWIEGKFPGYVRELKEYENLKKSLDLFLYFLNIIQQRILVLECCKRISFSHWLLFHK